MSPHWSAAVGRQSPYVPGEQPQLPGLVKLNTNENPYPPSPRVLEALRGEMGDSLRLYPEPTGLALRTAIDEARVDFWAESALPLIEKHADLLVVKTLSKSRSAVGRMAACANAASWSVDSINLCALPTTFASAWAPRRSATSCSRP